MPRPNRSEARRRELVPLLAAAFVELGYRRATTAELARRCGVQEPALYRLWPDKRALFVAAIEHVYEANEATWAEVLAEPDPARTGPARTDLERLVEYEARHLGENRLQRIVFAGLSEADDPRIAEALRELFRRFHRFLASKVRAARGAGAAPSAAEVAWALIGLGTLANLSRELDLIPDAARRRLVREVGGFLAASPGSKS